MSKNKLKYLLFFMISIALFLFPDKINAQDYTVSVSEIVNLNYGDKIGDARIIGTSSIEGVFSFYDENVVINNIDNVVIDVIFTPYDLDKYQSKRISVETSVLPRVISIVFDAPIYKQYDGTNNINLPAYQYVGILNEEVTIVGELNASLAGSYVGEGIIVNLSGVSVEGDKKDYYSLDLLNHKARIYPMYLEKNGEHASKILLDKDVYVDTGYSLKVIKEEVNDKIDNKYTSYLKYSYHVYNHHNNKLNIESNYKVSMEIDKSLIDKERLTVYELTSNGIYKEIDFSYENGIITFDIYSTSSIVFSTRDIEWTLINLFSGILIFSVVFIIVYKIKNSTIKSRKNY